MEINLGTVIPTIMGATIIGLFGWMFNINNTQIKHNEQIKIVESKIDKAVYNIDQEMVDYKFGNKRDSIDSLKGELIKLELQVEDLEKRLYEEEKNGNK